MESAANSGDCDENDASTVGDAEDTADLATLEEEVRVRVQGRRKAALSKDRKKVAKKLPSLPVLQHKVTKATFAKGV